MIYCELLANGNNKEDFNKFIHVIIDEAQDLGEFHYYILRTILKNANFSIFGDLAQSIYEARGIPNWEVVNSIFNSSCELLYLNKSYRTTIEITNSANNILNYIQLTPAIPVIRQGESVSFMDSSGDRLYENILNNLQDFLNNKNYKSIGIICKDINEGLHIKQFLDSKNFCVSMISSVDSEFIGGICILTSEQSKGLEFDSVIITDASEKKYFSNNTNDMRLLYVAMTRALHELIVYYDEVLTYPLNEKLVLDDNNKIRLINKK